MLQYVIRRLLILPLILFLVTLGLFVLILQLPPEERAQVYMSSGRPGLSPEEYARLVEKTIERHGLDRPVPTQYATWVGNLLTGNWGYSPAWRQDVLDGLLQRAPATIELAIAAVIPSVVLALVLGSSAARYQGRLRDHLIRGSAFAGWAFPSFILGLMLMTVFYVWLRWFPPERLSQWAKVIVYNSSSGFVQYTHLITVDALLNARLDILFDSLRHLVLPAFTVAIAQWALLTRIMRASLLEELRQDYVTTARAKGVREERIVGLHARRNALLPVISAGSVAVSLLIGGVVVIEAVFGLNGIGQGAAEAITQADVPVAVGFAILTCMVTVLASLVSDLLYAFVDPRVRLGRA